MLPTVDPSIVIEEERPGYVRYRCTDGRRWDVWGTCTYIGDCLVGAVNPILGPRESRLDVPVGPGFNGCCSLEVRALA